MTIRWTSRALQKIADNGVSRQEVEDAIAFAKLIIASESSGRPIACHWQGDRWLYVVYQDEGRGVIRPITAFYPSKGDWA